MPTAAASAFDFGFVLSSFGTFFFPGSSQRRCSWTCCMACAAKSRLARLAEDPLFHGPNVPCLLKPAFGEKALAGNGTVIICPGGNYEFLCPNEGLPVAAWLARHGIQALVLRYRLLPRHSLEDALADLEAAVSLVRQHKDGPVAAVGFSAGGHLVASLSLRLAKRDRPTGGYPLDAQVLVYPCIDSSGWGKPGEAGFWDPACHEKASSLLEGQQSLLGGDRLDVDLLHRRASLLAPPAMLFALLRFTPILMRRLFAEGESPTSTFGEILESMDLVWTHVGAVQLCTGYASVVSAKRVPLARGPAAASKRVSKQDFELHLPPEELYLARYGGALR
ncbi:Acetylxylan esterase [Symbiodinium microadriaticum]|uniref:Acetylxylan esterase n=1 Tax=Symbiodinium microadriaticum TaxID=2951 RepID=A0A1Q9C1K7_SYMMI|nr:Acetylxylan esterase [Symbiodinium microadriaticum]